MVRGRKSRKVQEREKAQVSTPVPAELLNVSGAARWLGVGRSTFFTLMQEDGFPIIRLTERCVRFDPNCLYAWALARQNRIA
jgi:hypothetical protein